MHKFGTRAAIAILGCTLAAGCGHINTRALPNINLASHKHIFVEHRLPDSYGVADEIARQLRVMGYDASSGALTMMPPDTELIVSYDDMWTWDFNNYIIEIDMQVRTARGDKTLAVGHYFRPSMVFGHPPADMIHELLVKLFRHA
jgi:GrpB-like predicted nucleotidyltransferase (UPF0157 family)